jgi:hypothetical protein
MDNPPNGINSFPNGFSAFPIGIATNVTATPIALDGLINSDEGARHYYDNMDDGERSELLRNAKKFQSKEELERYLYHLDESEFR